MNLAENIKKYQILKKKGTQMQVQDNMTQRQMHYSLETSTVVKSQPCDVNHTVRIMPDGQGTNQWACWVAKRFNPGAQLSRYFSRFRTIVTGYHRSPLFCWAPPVFPHIYGSPDCSITILPSQLLLFSFICSIYIFFLYFKYIYKYLISSCNDREEAECYCY